MNISPNYVGLKMSDTQQKPPQSLNILWLHWGRTGGGPRFLLELTAGDMSGPQIGHQYLSFNEDAEISEKFRELGLPSFTLRTYRSKLGVILGLPRLLVNSVRLHRWIKANDIDMVVGVMESVYQSISVPLFVPRSVTYVAGIHDGRHHPGETSLVQRIGRKLELWRADKVLTFSEEVAALVREQTQRPVIVASHPPFGVSRDNVKARSFPQGRPIVIGLFGRLQEYKGIDVLLEAAQILRTEDRFSALPSLEFRIVGNGPGEKFMQEDIGRESSWDVRWIPEDEVDEIVSTFDVMALPYTEASQSGPVSLALAQAIPCAVTPRGALPSQVEGFGVVANDATPWEFAEAIAEITGSKQRYEQLSKGAMEKIASTMLWDDLATLIRKS